MTHCCSALVAATMLLAVPLGAQTTGAIVGQVTGSAHHAVVGATVRLPEVSRVTETGAEGRFRIDGLGPREYRVEVTAIGHTPTIARVRVRAGQTTTLSVTLRERVVALEGVTVAATQPGSVRPAEDVLGQLLTVGAKSEVVEVKSLPANVAEKTPRQVFAKVPGIFVYDMDGAGNQVNVSTRGLDAHRSWEMNVRQDGVLINSDLYGYPASHYSPPMEAIQRIELIRGTAALQYGSQFGGLLNYITREGDPASLAHIESASSGGSNGLLSSYAALGGKSDAVDYYGYAQVRRSDGFRTNSTSDAEGQFGALTWRAAPTATVRVSVGRSKYIYQIPGALNDSMFRANPRASTRFRNYFSPDIVVPGASVSWEKSAATVLNVQVSGVFGRRNSVQLPGFANQPDTINPATGQYNPRQVDIDGFRSLTGELRLTHEYAFRSRTSTLAAGLMLVDNDLHRRQQGTGTTGTGYDLALSTGTFRRDIHYRTKNVAVYVENDMRLTPRWSVVPGARIERGESKMTGTLAYYDPANTARTVEHDFPLFGVRTTLRHTSGETYAGWSQAYRPMILKDLLPESPIERTDPNIKDARGWTVELGHRGTVRGIYFDVSGFLLRYDDRFGTLTLTDTGGPYVFKTNTGSSLTKGVELAIDAPLFTLPLSRSDLAFRVSTATSYFDASYRAGSVVIAGQNRSIVGNRVESVPRWISRNGLHASTSRTAVTLQVSHTSESFADALNTVIPPATGSVGLVPSYTILDINGSIRLAERVRLRGGVSNLMDKMYFTKRPAFYPGPGIWPSDGRGFQLGLDFDVPVVRR